MSRIYCGGGVLRDRAPPLFLMGRSPLLPLPPRSPIAATDRWHTPAACAFLPVPGKAWAKLNLSLLRLSSLHSPPHPFPQTEPELVEPGRHQYAFALAIARNAWASTAFTRSSIRSGTAR